MIHRCARLIVVAIATVSFSTPITAQQEPTSPTTVETLVETLGGRVSQNEQGEVVGVDLFGPKGTDASLAHLVGLAALERLWLVNTQVTDAGVAELQKALPNCAILLQEPIPPPPPLLNEVMGCAARLFGLGGPERRESHRTQPRRCGDHG